MEIREIMKLLHSLSVNGKLEIISRLTRELKSDIPADKERKHKLLDELYGSWKEMDENLVENILSSRTVSDRDINFD